MCCIFKTCSPFSPRHPLKWREQSPDSDTYFTVMADTLTEYQQRNSHQAESPNAP